MTTRIGIISDVHSSPAPLEQALQIFREAGVDDIICAGDIAGYYETLKPTVDLLDGSNCRAIVGNHDQSWLEKAPADCDPSVHAYLSQLPQTLELDIESRRVLVVHANPPSEQNGGGIRLLDPQGEVRPDRKEEWTANLADLDFDVLIVGHTHQVFAEQLGKVLVINPGSSVFNHSCMILSLPDMKVRIHALGNREVIKCWNFGMLYQRAGG